MQILKAVSVFLFASLAASQAPAGPAGFGFGSFGPSAPAAPAFGGLNLGVPAAAGGPAAEAPFAPAGPAAPGPFGPSAPAAPGPFGPAAPAAPAPYAHHGHHAHHHDYAVPTSYKFEYGVKDAHTGDHKQQQEHKDHAHLVKGSYELVEPDGSHRLVEYTSDEHKGFEAHITKKGPYVHPHGAHSYHNFNLYHHH